MRFSGATEKRFHGWHVVGALFICAFMIYGAGMYSFMLFVPSLSEHFHWGPTATGSLVSAFWVTAPLSLMSDRLIRRFGLKRLVTGGIAIEAVALICMFMATHFWQVYLLRVLTGLGKVCFAITLPIVLSKWFSHRFGTAIAIVYSGMFFSGIVFAPITHFLITSLGSRGASTALGMAVLVVALPLALWILRAETAGRVDVRTDKHSSPIATTSSRLDVTHSQSENLTTQPTARFDLWRNRDLRVIAISRTLYYTVMAGPFVYQTAVVNSSAGFAHTNSMLLGFTAAFIGAGELVSGFLIDRLSWKWAMVIQHTLFGIGLFAMLMFALQPSFWSLAIYAPCFGLAYGGSDPFWTTTLKQKLAPSSFQKAWGPVYFFGLAVSVLWPICFGWLRDLTGSYAIPLAISLFLLAVPLSLSLAAPLRRE
jgi:MFS family permease